MYKAELITTLCGYERWGIYCHLRGKWIFPSDQTKEGAEYEARKMNLRIRKTMRGINSASVGIFF